MPFRRFFDRGSKEAPPNVTADVEASVEAGADATVDSPDEEGSDEDAEAFDAAAVEAEEAGAADWRARARAVLPTGASTGSKRAEALYGSPDAIGPTHFTQAVGCRIIDTNGNELIDCTMALGAVALGYAEPNVTRAVIDVVSTGHVSGLSSVFEVDVAERLCGVIPCADRVQFLKSGAEAMSAAVRIARTYTARDLVIASGYFGWSDWCSGDAAGVPEGTRRALQRVPYDDVPALERAVSDAGAQLAAIVIEPVVERLPSVEWITRARELATAAGAVLVFDEIKTGFRLRTGGYQAYAEIVPDLAAFGKAMANGYPLAAVVGDRDVMDAARNTWISSTLASDAASLAAAAAVLSWHDSADICESLWAIGADLRRAVTSAIEASGIGGVTVDGLDPMWMLRFDRPDRERRFLELAVSHGVLFKRGAYNYAALAHDDEAIRLIEGAASAALVDLRDEEAAE